LFYDSLNSVFSSCILLGFLILCPTLSFFFNFVSFLLLQFSFGYLFTFSKLFCHGGNRGIGLVWNLRKKEKNDGKEEVVPAVSVIDKNVLARDPSTHLIVRFEMSGQQRNVFRDKRAVEREREERRTATTEPT
jgi:hypothetical protein